MIIKILGKEILSTEPTKPNTEIINTNFLHSRYSTYPENGLTPEKIASLLKRADEGEISPQMELLSAIERKDSHIFSLLNRRKRSVLKRTWNVNAADTKEGIFKTHAEYVNKVILDLKDFDLVRFNALDAIGKAFSTQWIEWVIGEGNYIHIKKFHFVDQHKFRTGLATDLKSDLNELRLLTDEALVDGVPLEANKWFIPIIQATSGDLGKTSLLRILVWNYLFKNFNIKAWVQFAELYGIPLRIGKYGAGAGEEEKSALLQALYQIGQDASAIISDSTKIEFIEAMTKAASFDSYEKLCDYLDKQSSKVILGHSAVADSTTGKLGGEDTAEDAIFDFVESDAKGFDNAFNAQVIVPLINFKFGKQEYYPTFKTIVLPSKDRSVELDIMNKFQQPIARTDYYEAAGIRIPEENEEVFTPSAQQQSQFGNPFAAKEIMAADVKKKV